MTGYPDSPGQLAQASPETYWQACRDIYAQVRQVLKPGGVFCLILKSYIKDGKIVDLPADTLKLLVHLEFEPLEIVHAMLVKEEDEHTLFEGKIIKKTERKSFFRRLAEAKGSPSIDYEVVLFVRKGAA